MDDSEIEFETLRHWCGTAMFKPKDALEEVDASGIRPGDFSMVKWARVFSVVEAALRAGVAVDPLLIAERLKGKVATVDSASLFDGSMGFGETTTKRLEVIHEYGQRREMVDGLRAVAACAKNRSEPLNKASEEALRIVSSWQVESGQRTMEGSLDGLLTELELVQQGKMATTIPSGIGALDAVIGGLQPTLTMVGALPGVGKSALVAGILRQLARRRVKAGLISLEDEGQWLTRRWLAESSGVPVFILANRKMTSDQLRQVNQEGVSVFDDLRHVVMDDRQGMTVDQVVSSARRMVSMGCKAIFIDHLGEVAMKRSERHDLDIADALRALRGVAKTTRTPVVVLSHLRRREGGGVDTEPRLTDFAFSSGIERMARVALGLWQAPEGGPDAGNLRVTIMKQTQGKSGVTVSLNVNKGAGVVIATAAPKEDPYATVE